MSYGEGTWSHLEGFGGQSIGKFSHSQGYFCVSSGDFSSAGGHYSVAQGSGSFVYGKNAESTNDGQVIFSDSNACGLITGLDTFNLKFSKGAVLQANTNLIPYITNKNSIGQIDRVFDSGYINSLKINYVSPNLSGVGNVGEPNLPFNTGYFNHLICPHLISPCAVWGWVNVYNSGGTPITSGSYNVSSITDNDIGNFTVNWTTPLSNKYYSVVGTSQLNTNVTLQNPASQYKTVNSVNILCQVMTTSAGFDGDWDLIAVGRA